MNTYSKDSKFMLQIFTQKQSKKTLDKTVKKEFQLTLLLVIFHPHVEETKYAL